MQSAHLSRRTFLANSAMAAASAAAAAYFPWTTSARANTSANDRLGIGCVGVGSKGNGDAREHVIVEALRREGSEIELRLAECLGKAGTAQVTLRLPHLDAALTDMLGGHAKKLAGESGLGILPKSPATRGQDARATTYKFPIRPQQIVTMRFKTADTVPAVKPLTEWDELVPEKKREALRRYQPDVKGHPPAEWLQPKPKEKKQP